MTLLSQFVGGRLATRAIVNTWSVNGAAQSDLTIAIVGCVLVPSGLMSAGVLKQLLSINGSGDISSLCVANSGVNQTIRVKVTVDGVVVWDYTTASSSGVVVGAFLTGRPTVSAAQTGPIVFKTSVLVEAASSVNGTDTMSLAYACMTN